MKSLISLCFFNIYTLLFLVIPTNQLAAQANQCSTTDSLALLNFYINSNGAYWTESWTFSQPMSSWYGVGLNADRCVISLDLRCVIDGPISSHIGDLTQLEEFHINGVNITSGLPVEIGQLQSLKTLSAHGIEGPFQTAITNLVNLEHLSLSFKIDEAPSPIPSSIDQLVSLKSLFLSNSINGSIPNSIGQLLQLESIHLRNCGFSGAIPSQIGQLNSLKKLILAETTLTGSLPSELGNLASIEEISIIGNDISGSIPASIGNLQHLKTLNLGDNELSGSIPPELSQIGSLANLTLKQNLLSNSIPTEFQNFVNLSYLNLSDNQLTGNIPVTIGNINSLNVLDLSNNQLIGDLPESIGNLTNLVKLRIQNNTLSGTIPPSFSNLTNIDKLYLGDNNLLGCFDASLVSLCESNSLLIIDHGNNFNVSFYDFCQTRIGECACSFNRVVEDQILTGTYKASNDIMSNGIVIGSNSVQYEAGNSILLNPNFLTEANAAFEATINDCN